MRRIKSMDLALMAFALAAMDNTALDTTYGKKKKGRKLNPNPNAYPNFNPNGLTKFIIDGKEIYALNEKNAIRKANNNK